MDMESINLEFQVDSDTYAVYKQPSFMVSN
jgi:hypothetical protein